MSNIHDNIKKRRTELGMSQIELAERVGYKTPSTIAKIESGDRNFPQSKLMLFASALNVDPLWLLGYEAVPPDDQDVVSALAKNAKSLLDLPPDIAALNVLLYEIGEVIQRTDDGYFTASTGFLSDDDIAFLKSTASNALRPAVDMLAKRRERELRAALSGKEVDT